MGVGGGVHIGLHFIERTFMGYVNNISNEHIVYRKNMLFIGRACSLL